jgi:hypothetical protein
MRASKKSEIFTARFAKIKSQGTQRFIIQIINFAIFAIPKFRDCVLCGKRNLLGQPPGRNKSSCRWISFKFSLCRTPRNDRSWGWECCNVVWHLHSTSEPCGAILNFDFSGLRSPFFDFIPGNLTGVTYPNFNYFRPFMKLIGVSNIDLIDTILAELEVL